MNIQQAKEEIKHTLLLYHQKDESGAYLYPPVRQRPILLIGMPGIGKTAIMEQIAEECGVGLVSYTMTHHTRQSAVGLPQIVKENFDGVETETTRYTMSEIIASVLSCMKRTGHREGILFLDEINCVSETLTPVILELLQNKRFGTHRVPEGWMIVAAGNPPAYNRSAREFDIVTLDRVRQIDVEPDVDIWLDYASSRGLHGAILSYLRMKPDRFYLVENTPEKKRFVTARGWEDLSWMIRGSEKLGFPVTADQVEEYLQDRSTAESFASWLAVWNRYQGSWKIREIIEGTASCEDTGKAVDSIRGGSFEERFMAAALILDVLSGEAECYEREKAYLMELRQCEKSLEMYAKARERENGNSENGGINRPGPAGILEEFAGQQENALKIRKQNDLITPEEERIQLRCIRDLRKLSEKSAMEHIRTRREAETLAAADLCERQESLGNMASALSGRMERGLAFAEQSLSGGTELLLTVSGLKRRKGAASFLKENRCDTFERLYQEIFGETQRQNHQ